MLAATPPPAPPRPGPTEVKDRILRQARGLKLRAGPARAIALHTTGRALTARATQIADSDDPDDVDEAALHWYETSGAAYFAGYFIGRSAGVWRFAPDDRVALHAAALNTRYSTAQWSRHAKPLGGSGWVEHGDPEIFRWWSERWPELKSPLELPTGKNPNGVSIGIDILPGLDGGYTEEQHRICAALVLGLCAQYDIRHDRRHVLGHEDIDPCARGTVVSRGKIVGKPWDPGAAFRWAALALAP